MTFFSQQMLRIAIELASHEPLYEEFVSKFFEHTVRIAGAMDRIGDNQDEMWDEEDGFFYDVLRFSDGSATRLKVRSMVDWRGPVWMPVNFLLYTALIRLYTYFGNEF
jgi:hypothetical protein